MEIVKRIQNIEKSVKDGKIYRLTTRDGKTGRVRAEVKEEWTEVHPKTIRFVIVDGEVSAGSLNNIVDIVELGD